MKTLILSLLLCSCGAAVDAALNSAAKAPTATPVETVTPIVPTATEGATVGAPVPKLEGLCKTDYSVQRLWSQFEKNAVVDGCNNAIPDNTDKYFLTNYCTCIISCLINTYTPTEWNNYTDLIGEQLLKSVDRCVAYAKKTYTLTGGQNE